MINDIFTWGFVIMLWIYPSYMLLRGRYREFKNYRADRKAFAATMQCQHLEVHQITSPGLGVVAFLCKAEDCQKTLYPEEWLPKGCKCKPAENVFRKCCEVKDHTQRAAILGNSEECSDGKCRVCNFVSVQAKSNRRFSESLMELYPGEMVIPWEKKYSSYCETHSEYVSHSEYVRREVEQVAAQAEQFHTRFAAWKSENFASWPYAPELPEWQRQAEEHARRVKSSLRKVQELHNGWDW